MGGGGGGGGYFGGGGGTASTEVFAWRLGGGGGGSSFAGGPQVLNAKFVKGTSLESSTDPDYPKGLRVSEGGSVSRPFFTRPQVGGDGYVVISW
jgi:hypothetical protein